MNRVILIGRLTRDPEIRYTQTGKTVASMGIAVDRWGRKSAESNGQPTADFFNIVAWEQRAEFCGKYFKKGSRIGVEGRLQSRSYEGKDGIKRNIVEVVAENVEFCDSKNSSYSAPQDDGFPTDDDYPGAGAKTSAKPAANEFGNDIDEEEIPF